MSDDRSEDHEARVRHISALLEDKQLVTAEEIDDRMAEQAPDGLAQGARLVVRAWTDSHFRQRLLTDAKAAAAELGIDASPITRFDVLENTRERHHVIVCTLCSCYPRVVLGNPPDWYKSTEYRARVVREPRAVLREFGLTLEDDVQAVVVDSTADRRFMVLPRRPEGSDAMGEQELLGLVTRDSMIGVGHPKRIDASSHIL